MSILFHSNPFPNGFSIHQWPLTESIIALVVAKWDFLFLLFLWCLLAGFLCKKELSTIPLSMNICGFMVPFLKIECVIIYPYHPFCCSNCTTFGQWEPLQGSSCVLLSCLHSYLSTSSFLAYFDVLGLYCTFLTPGPGPNYFSSELWCLEKQDLGTQTFL